MGRLSNIVAMGAILVLATALPEACGADEAPWLHGESRARPRLDPYGSAAFEVTNTRYGRLNIYRSDRKGVMTAIFEEVTTRNEPGGPTIDAHTKLRVWGYDELRPSLGNPLYTIDIDCDNGRFIPDSFRPDFYEMTCGGGADYRFHHLYRTSDGAFMGEFDGNPAFIDVSSDERSRKVLVSVRVLGYPLPHYGNPPYPFALLTVVTGDGVLDRVVVAHDSFDRAETMAAIADTSHKLAFGSVGDLSKLLGVVSEGELSSIRLIYLIRSDMSEQLVIPLKEAGLAVEGASLPTGFSLIRVPPTGNLGHGFVDPKLRELH